MFLSFDLCKQYMNPPRQQPKTFSLSGFFQITRVQNLVVIFLAQYFSAIFLIRGNNDFAAVLSDYHLFATVISTVFIAAAGYIINDYYDIKIDLINRPDKVVAGTLLKRRTVMAAHSILNFTGILLGLWVAIKIGVLDFIAAFLLWLYSNQLKRTPFFGNFVVASLTGLSVILIGLYYDQIQIPILLYSSFAFTSNLVREIIKDIEDLQGDEKFGSKSLPILWGVRKTKLFLHFIDLSFSGFVVYLLISQSFPASDLILYFFLASVFVFTILLIRAEKRTDFGVLSGYLKWFMLIGIASMTLIQV